MSLITVGGVSPVFPFTLFTVLLDAHSAYGEVVCVLFLLKHQSSYPQTCFLLDTAP